MGGQRIGCAVADERMGVNGFRGADAKQVLKSFLHKLGGRLLLLCIAAPAGSPDPAAWRRDLAIPPEQNGGRSESVPSQESGHHSQSECEKVQETFGQMLRPYVRFICPLSAVDSPLCGGGWLGSCGRGRRGCSWIGSVRKRHPGGSALTPLPPAPLPSPTRGRGERGAERSEAG